MTINENPSGLPEQEPTSTTAVVLLNGEAWVKTGADWESLGHLCSWGDLRNLAAERGGATLFDLADLPTGLTEVQKEALSDGTKQWRLHGKRHRTDGPAIEWADGSKQWYLNDKRHRTDGPAIEWADGSKQWWLDDKLHRTDGPAVERADGSKTWLLHGLLHRTDGPAFERADGYKEWYVHGKLHLTDGPAIETPDGYKAWYVDDKLHRTDGPAVEWADGSKQWWLDGRRHRADGPAVEWADGTKEWYVHGERHRTDGPAIETPDGTKTWYSEGKRLTEAEHAKRTGVPMSNPLGNFQTVAFEIVEQLEGAADSIRRLATMEHTSDAVEVARSIVAEVTGIPANANLTRLVLAAGGAQRTTKES